MLIEKTILPLVKREHDIKLGSNNSHLKAKRCTRRN